MEQQGIYITTGVIIQFTLTIVAGLLVFWIKNITSRTQKLQEQQIDDIRKKQKEDIKDINDRLKDGDKRMTAIEKNYTARFEEVNSSIHNTRAAVLTAIGDLKETMLERFVTKEDCRVTQEMHKP